MLKSRQAKARFKWLLSQYMRLDSGERLFSLNSWTTISEMRLRYLIFSSSLFAWIFGVMGLFWWIPDRRVAGLIAGAMFCFMPAAIFWIEVRVFNTRNLWWMLGHLQFLLLFALPILGLRLLYWDVEFSNIEMFGLPVGVFLHRASSWSYFLMLVLNIIAFFKSKETSVR